MIPQESFSFSIVSVDKPDSWSEVRRLADSHLDKRGLDRLLNVVKGRCQCIVIERHYIDRDFRNTFSHFHSKKFKTLDSRCIRLHFFSRSISEEEIVNSEDTVQDAYLGYSIIRPTRPNCVGRTLLDHRLRLNGSAHLSVCKEHVHLFGSRFEVSGFPFISQDTDATVCAESALWMILRYYSNRYPAYSEILPFEITELASKHAVGRRVFPSSGLYSWQLAETLRLRGFSPVVYSRLQFSPELGDRTFDHLLYTYIESGIPLLVTVPEHVVVGFGHASDYSAPGPPAQSKPEFLYTSHFNRSFIINDDNHYPYQELRQTKASGAAGSRFSWEDIKEFIVPLPEKVFLTAELVQPAIEHVLRDEDFGIPSSPSLKDKSLVFRLFLTSARTFKRSLKNRKMGHRTVQDIYRHLPMPHFIWICEIAEYDDYCEKRLIKGEIIWDATRNATEPGGWIALHLPEYLSVDIGSALNRSQRMERFALTKSNSYSLFDSNLHTL